MAQALFNAGVITRAQLDAANDEVKRAAEALEPHLTLHEKLRNDIAGALRKKPAKPKGPGKGRRGR